MLARLSILSLIIASPLLGQDTTAAHVPVPAIAVNVTTGTMEFSDQRVQQGVTGVLRYHVFTGISIAASPTFARVAFPSTLGGGSVSGLTDLPVELAADHSFDIPGSPTAGMSLGISLPIGDKAVGFGSGAVGANVGVGVGVSPIDPLSFHVGAGKALNDYSLYSALGTSSSAWGDVEASYQLMDRLEATIGIDGDIASADSLGPSRAVAMSLAMNVAGPYAITVSGGHGISGIAARWTFALGFGTDFTGLQALGSSSPIQRFMRSLGGGSHSGNSGSTPGSGHGRAP
jgi:hypothetical protein